MQTIAAILITAAATAGTVRAAKTLRRVLQRRKGSIPVVSGGGADGPVIDLERDHSTGIYSQPKRF
jgi:hypothetical protein